MTFIPSILLPLFLLFVPPTGAVPSLGRDPSVSLPGARGGARLGSTIAMARSTLAMTCSGTRGCTLGGAGAVGHAFDADGKTSVFIPTWTANPTGDAPAGPLHLPLRHVIGVLHGLLVAAIQGPSLSSNASVILHEYPFSSDSANSLISVQPGTEFTVNGSTLGGLVLHNAGDCNGDSYDDVLLGLPGDGSSNAAVYISFGAAAGTQRGPLLQIWAQPFASAIAGIDVTNDAVHDIVILTTLGVTIIPGSKDAGDTAAALGQSTVELLLVDLIPSSLAGATPIRLVAGPSGKSDINGDGRDDVLLVLASAPDQHHVTVLLGSTNGLVGTAVRIDVEAEHLSVALVPPSSPDAATATSSGILIGTASLASMYPSCSGECVVQETPEYGIPSPYPGFYLDHSITAGDINQDGNIDVAFGCPEYTGATDGRVGSLVLSSDHNGATVLFLGPLEAPSAGMRLSLLRVPALVLLASIVV